MNLRAIGCNFQTAPVEVREKLAFDKPKLDRALGELNARYGAEAVILSTCNRVELYLARPEVGAALHAPLVAEFLGEVHGLPADAVHPHLYEHADAAAVRHVFRVTSSLDSLIVGEGQIAGQVRDAFDAARAAAATGPLLNALFPSAARVSKRVRTETDIAKGHVSVSSVAVDFVRQVFDHFTDKTVLVVGAGKMGRLTLKHLQELNPGRVLVTNRSPQKAAAVAELCGGRSVPWDQLDDALVQADIVLSTTGAASPIVTHTRFREKVLTKRTRWPVVIFDMAVPRDFDPRVDDGERVFLYNVDDLNRIREQTLAERRRHLAPAEAIVDAEVRKFVEGWNHQQNGPVIGQLTGELDKLREGIVGPLLGKLNGKLTAAEKDHLEGAFRLFQNRILHGPMAALRDASKEGHGGGLRDALRMLFGLKE
jgi:glutamyl-tRNA reductase